MAIYLPSDPSLITTARGRDEIYIATTPLRATKGPAQLVMSAAYSLNLWDLQHFMLIVKPFNTATTVSPLSNSQVTVFDFQPQDPEDIYVALAALSSRPIPGTTLVRKMSKLPKKKRWYIGSSNRPNAIQAAYEFNSSWKTDLCIGVHDCRHYTNGLAEMLTGEKNVLERLRQESTGKIMLDDGNKIE